MNTVTHNQPFSVDVVYVAPNGAITSASCTIAAGATAEVAVRRSGLAEQVNADIFKLQWGVYGLPIPPETVLNPGDRVEIYSPVSKTQRQFAQTRLQQHRQQKFSQY